MSLSCLDLLKTLNSFSVDAKLVGSDHSIRSIQPIESCSEGSLTFAETQQYLETALQNKSSVVVVPIDLDYEQFDLGATSLILVENVRVALAFIRQRHDDHDPRQSEWSRLHSSAVIHETVVLSESVHVGPGAVIGAQVTLGEDVVIMANAVVEHSVVIAEKTVIHACCVIGRGCKIGANVIIKPGAIIGAEGHGFARDNRGRFHRIPQRGNVVIEDNVVIGANCTIDRATYHETRVHRGCIIDAQCHLAHNVVVGEDCALVAQTGIAGSSRFGKRVMASGQTGVLDHVSVPDDTVLVHRAGVINSIRESGMYASTPPQPFARYLKNIAVFQRLAEVWDRLRAVEKKVSALTDKH